MERPEKPRGDAEEALAVADVRIDAVYVQPFEHHNPMEMHASTMVYEADGSLTIYDKAQGAHERKDQIPISSASSWLTNTRMPWRSSEVKWRRFSVTTRRAPARRAISAICAS